MSRIGIKPITLPAGVEVKVDDKNVVTVKGPKGELAGKGQQVINSRNKRQRCNSIQTVDAKAHRAQHGLARTLIQQHGDGRNRRL